MPRATLERYEITYSAVLQAEVCCNCHVIFAMTAEMVRRLRGHSDQWFYCPNGHRQHYTDEQDKVDRLQAQLTAERTARMQALDQAAAANRDLRAAQAEARKLAKRAKAGTCPCCHRTFQQLTRHMKTQHPDYAKETR